MMGDGRWERNPDTTLACGELQALRQPDALRALAVLAAAPGIHIVASQDHVNGALASTPGLRASFNWVGVPSVGGAGRVERAHAHARADVVFRCVRACMCT